MLILISGLIACRANHHTGTLESGVNLIEGGHGNPESTGLSNLLPPPSALADEFKRLRNPSYAEADLIKAGGDFSQTLPNNLAIDDGTGASLSPNWSSGDDLSKLAYCMYAFQITDYDRNGQVRLDWNAQPDPPGNVWIGLARWPRDRWDWYANNSTGVVNVYNMDDYFAFGGGMLVCIAVTGNDPGNLAEIRIGTQAPVAVMGPGAWRGWAPKTIEFNGALSSDPDGSIVKYEWDLDGDGTFELDTGTTDWVTFEYSVPGSYRPAMRVTDNDSVTSTVHSDVGVAEEFSRTFGGSSGDFIDDMALDPGGYIYQVGHTYNAGDQNSGLIVKYSVIGEAIWARTFDGPGWDSFSGVTIGNNGEIFVCGTTTSFGSGQEDGLMQRWDSDGNLVWSKVWGGTGEDYFEDLVTSNGDPFIVGRSSSFGSFKATVVHIHPDGGLVWHKYFGGTSQDAANAIVRSQELLGNPELHIIGYQNTDDAFDFDILYYNLRESGYYNSRKKFTAAGAQEGTAVSPPNSWGAKLIVAGKTYSGLSTDLLVTSPSDGWAKRWDLGARDDFTDIVRLPDGNYMMAGQSYHNGEGWYDAVLCSITGDGDLGGFEVRDWKGQVDCAAALCAFPGGVLIGGSAADNTKEFHPGIQTLHDFTGTWNNVFWMINDASTGIEILDTNGTVSDFTGVQDAGGGEADCFLELRRIDTD